MSRLLTTGKDCPTPSISPDIVDWSAVSRLAVLDILDANDRPVLFAPIVVWADDTWARLTDTLDITTARATCARLSAIYDKPVQDWTRPAPPNLARLFYTWACATCGLVPTKPGFEAPEEEPVWGPGWNETDWLFMDGATDAEFEATLLETTKAIRAASVFGDENTEQVDVALSIQVEEARHRWVMLHAANEKPAPSPEGEGA